MNCSSKLLTHKSLVAMSTLFQHINLQDFGLDSGHWTLPFIHLEAQFYKIFVGPLPRVRPRNGILALLFFHLGLSS